MTWPTRNDTFAENFINSRIWCDVKRFCSPNVEGALYPLGLKVVSLSVSGSFVINHQHFHIFNRVGETRGVGQSIIHRNWKSLLKVSPWKMMEPSPGRFWKLEFFMFQTRKRDRRRPTNHRIKRSLPSQVRRRRTTVRHHRRTLPNLKGTVEEQITSFW